jgi:hypothetical protein
VVPLPIAETCPTCRVAGGVVEVPARAEDLQNAVVVLRFADGTEQSLALSPPTLAGATAYSFALPPPPTASPLEAAYVTAFKVPPAAPPYSVIDQIFVEP